MSVPLSPVSLQPSPVGQDTLNNRLQLIPMTRRDFDRFFQDCEGACLTTDEFEEPREIDNITSADTADCVTLFGISKDKTCMFARHMSTLQNPSLEAQDDTILSELRELFGIDSTTSSVYHSDEEESKEPDTKKIGSFDLYLVGGNGSEESDRLIKGIERVIPRFFDQNTQIVDAILHQAHLNSKNYITANLNLHGELRYYFHNHPHA